MKCLIFTHKGFEQECANEIKESIGKTPKIDERAVIFETDSNNDIIKAAYTLQSAVKVLLLLDKFTFIDQKDLLEKIKKIDFSSHFCDDQKFVVRCKSDSKKIESCRELEAEIGDIIDGNVDIKNPDIEFYCYFFNDTAYITVDLCGFDISKRDYKVFTGATAIKPTLCFCMLMLSRYDIKKTILDPFSTDGAFCIEAALYALKRPVQYYNKDRFAFLKLKDFTGSDSIKYMEKLDKEQKSKELKINVSDYVMRGVVAARKNAKIAGVLDNINFSRVDIDWLDIKYGKNSIDTIIARPPVQSSKISPEQSEKFYSLFFKRANQILVKNGQIIFIVVHENPITEYAKASEFILKQTIQTRQGEMDLKVLVFDKGT